MSNKSPWRRSLIGLAAVSSLLLTGCAAESSSSDDPAAIKDEVVVALAGDIDNFDPHTNQLIIFEFAIRELVFSTLVDYDAELNFQPDLATYEVNEDATVFTFSLVPDAVFHDGTSVDAAAVIASMERAGTAEDSIWSGRLADVASYEAPDDQTVVITLNNPDATFLAGLASIAIVAPSSFDTATSEPVGSGPYEFESWTANTEIVLTSFDDYFGEVSPTKTLRLQPIADQQVALNNLYSGSVDILASASAATVSQLDSARADLVEPVASNSLSLIEFNSSGKLADPMVRQALAHALDKASIREIAYGGGGSSSWSPLPESSWAYSEQTGYEYDLDKAATMLAAAGESDLEFSLEVPSGFPEAEQLARVWQASLAEIGVTLNVNITEISVWLDAYVSRGYDATWNVFNVGADPHSFFDIIMTPHLADDYQNQTVSDLVLDATRISDEAARSELYSELQQILVDELPVMIVQSTPVASIAGPDVSGYEVNPLGWALLSQVTVSK
ncbi:ABC transporter substrate-binding protein [uncultured Salinibacterium sp.]|uniref:ABC transporter substrate-binding protein n=1 Tax=uncultured Salinibacterium sp. TaxID=459274 RepID=UPI0030DD0606